MKHVHFIGIGGTGLSAIARVLLEKGIKVSGSDQTLSPLADELVRSGAVVYIGHRPEQINGADFIVRSSAIPDENAEVLAGQRAGIPVLKRNQFLPSLLEGSQVIGVAGTHGKTTTTAMIAWALKSLGEDPSYIIGSVAHNLGTNAHAGKGRYFVIEADEYDDMFLGLEPLVAVVTMVEHDHPDFYPTAEAFAEAFEQFAARIKPQGKLIGCIDDPGVRNLLHSLQDSSLELISYSLQDTAAEYYAQNLQAQEFSGYSFQAFQGDIYLADISLQVPGEFNVQNAVAALAVIDQLGLPVKRAAGALSTFQGTVRRFQIIGEVEGTTIIDDYAHHPTEIQATLAGARKRFPGKRIWAVWQPHTYSRTREYLLDFAHSFSEADRLIVTDIYPAREKAPLNGFSAVDVVNVIQQPEAIHLSGFNAPVDYLVQNLQPGDVLLVLSAGDADQISRRVLEKLTREYEGSYGK